MDKVQRSKLSGSFRIEIEQKISKNSVAGIQATSQLLFVFIANLRSFPDGYKYKYHRRPNESSSCPITALLQDIRNSLRTISVIRSLRTSAVALVFSTFLLVDVL